MIPSGTASPPKAPFVRQAAAHQKLFRRRQALLAPRTLPSDTLHAPNAQLALKIRTGRLW